MSASSGSPRSARLTSSDKMNGTLISKSTLPIAAMNSLAKSAKPATSSKRLPANEWALAAPAPASKN